MGNMTQEIIVVITESTDGTVEDVKKKIILIV